MMNIFIMFLVMLFMGTFYMLSSPNQHVTHQETAAAITRSDLRAIAECTAAKHNAQIKGTEFNDICVEQNGITSELICLNDKRAITGCEIVRNKKPAYSYIITAAAPIDEASYNNIMETLEQYYPDAGTFGILQDNFIMAGGTSGKRVVPAAIIEKMNLVPGQLIYITQYEIPDTDTEFIAPYAADITCPAGTIKTYRFGRWQCIGYNLKTDCGGDMIWDSDLMECVPDESRKPLCAAQQTAVMVDDVWECINPFPERKCPDKMILRLNYNTLEWECVMDPNAVTDTKKCVNITPTSIYGTATGTLRVPNAACTDCERMITDNETCSSYCVPDPSKLSDEKCYPGNTRDCNGNNRAFYFGFPNFSYADNVPEISNRAIPFDRRHSQNRKFNCMDCGERGINNSKSFPPYIVICNE